MNKFVRKVDVLGRIIIPKEIREQLQINEDDKVKIYISKNTIKMKKIKKE